MMLFVQSFASSNNFGEYARSCGKWCTIYGERCVTGFARGEGGFFNRFWDFMGCNLYCLWSTFANLRFWSWERVIFRSLHIHTDSIGENVTVKNYDASGLVSAAKNDSCCISLVWVVLRGMFHTVECLICEVIANENNDSQE